MGFEWREQPRMHGERHSKICPDAFFFFFNLFLNWRKFALQCSVGFHHTTMQISSNYTCITSLWSLPPFPCATRLGHRRAPGWPPRITRQLLASRLSDTGECANGDAAFCLARPLLAPLCPRGPSLCPQSRVCGSIPFLHVGSSISATFLDSVYTR